MRLHPIFFRGCHGRLLRGTALAQETSSAGGSTGDAQGVIELPEVEVEAASGNANTSPMEAFQDKMNAMDQSRDSFLLPKLGATSYNMDYEAIETCRKVSIRPSTK